MNYEKKLMKTNLMYMKYVQENFVTSITDNKNVNKHYNFCSTST